MKMRLMTFNEACEAFREAYPMSANFTDQSFLGKSLLGIRKNSIPWGKKVEVDINTLINGHIPTYQLNGFSVPTCVFKADDANLNDVLRYGTILTNDELYDHYYPMDKYVRIRIIAYNGTIYYHKMVNGEVIEFKKVGIVE